jgi:hypothetical protein
MTDFAMPQALELEAARRNGIPAVRREVVHNTTTQNEYRPGELCYIPVDTGAAGAFMDTTTTRLEMTIVVRNKNYFVDMINLPRCGWNAIIQEFGIEINNGLHELNRHYAECIELDMIKRGENRTPFEIVRPNPYKVGEGLAGMKHINFVKPSMVTHLGLPHNVKYAPMTTSTANTTPDIVNYGALLGSNSYLHQAFGRSLGTDIPNVDFAASIDYDSHLGKVLTTNMMVPQSHWDDRAPAPRWKMDKTQLGTQFGSTNADIADQDNAPTAVGQKTNINSKYRLVGGPGKYNTLGQQAWVSPGDPYGSVFAAGSNIWGAAYGQSVQGISAGQWPAYQPTDWVQLQKEIKESLSKVNADNIITYYANCKNIPVGIPLDISADETGSTAIWGDSAHTKPAIPTDNGAETEFQVSLKVYSSLIGELTKKWFPELIVPQGRMRVRLRFQEPQILFQTLMDPCRRVPGTSRDWFPYLGMIESKEVYKNGGAQADGTLITARPISQLAQCSVEMVASGVHPVMIANYSPGFCFTPSIATGQFPIPSLRLRQLGQGVGLGFIDNYDYAQTTAGTGTTRENYYPNTAALRYVKMDPVEYASTDGSFGAYLTGLFQAITGVGEPADVPALATETRKKLVSVATLLHRTLIDRYMNDEIGIPWVFHQNHADDGEAFLAASTAVGEDISIRCQDVQQIQFPTGWRNLKAGFAPATAGAPTAVTSHDTATQSASGGKFYESADASNWDRKWKGLNYYPFCVPTPQYVPFYNPSNKTTARVTTISDFLTEEESCFGTHLERSVAQVRRTHSTLYPLKITDQQTSRIDERLTYIVRNIQLVTQQIVLPRTAAISIVENALNGGISMETIAWKEIESMLPKAESQKHLINMAAAFCNSLTFVFRPIDTYQGDRAYGYNSFSFYNPFTVFRFDYNSVTTPAKAGDAGKASDYNDLGGTPVYYNECVVATRVPFDIQLQLSAELYPRTPIDTINRLLMHTRWGDQVFTSNDFMELAPALQPSYLTSKGQVINTLQDGFWAAFVPISALDDQTITCNPFFTPLEMSIRKRIRGYRAPTNALPIYKPYDGTFHISFNLEAFMGQSGRMRTGVPIVNNNMFLKMEKCHLLREYDTQLLTICECDAKVVFERGGTMQFFT